MNLSVIQDELAGRIIRASRPIGAGLYDEASRIESQMSVHPRMERMGFVRTSPISVANSLTISRAFAMTTWKRRLVMKKAPEVTSRFVLVGYKSINDAHSDALACWNAVHRIGVSLVISSAEKTAMAGRFRSSNPTSGCNNSRDRMVASSGSFHCIG